MDCCTCWHGAEGEFDHATQAPGTTRPTTTVRRPYCGEPGGVRGAWVLVSALVPLLVQVAEPAPVNRNHCGPGRCPRLPKRGGSSSKSCASCSTRHSTNCNRVPPPQSTDDVANAFARVQRVAWRDLRVGDMVKVQRGQVLPADIVFLCAVSDDGEASDVCYVQTAQLDGETNLKLRSTLQVCSPYRGARSPMLTTHIACRLLP